MKKILRKRELNSPLMSFSPRDKNSYLFSISQSPDEYAEIKMTRKDLTRLVVGATAMLRRLGRLGVV